MTSTRPRPGSSSHAPVAPARRRKSYNTCATYIPPTGRPIGCPDPAPPSWASPFAVSLDDAGELTKCVGAGEPGGAPSHGEPARQPRERSRASTSASPEPRGILLERGPWWVDDGEGVHGTTWLRFGVPERCVREYSDASATEACEQQRSSAFLPAGCQLAPRRDSRHRRLRKPAPDQSSVCAVTTSPSPSRSMPWWW